MKIFSLLFLSLFLMLNSAVAQVVTGGKTDKGSVGSYYEWDDKDAMWGLQFDAKTDMTLVSVKVYNGESTSGSYEGVRTFTVFNAAGEIVATSTVNVVNGEQRLVLNMFVPAGNEYRLISDRHVGLWRDKSGSTIEFPYNIGTIAAITNDVRYDGASQSTDNYHFFYDWEVKESSAPVKSKFKYSYIARDVTFVNNSSGATSYLWDFGDGTTSTEPMPTHTYSSNNTFKVTLTATNGEESSLSSATFSVTDVPLPGGELPVRSNKALLELSTSTGCGLCPAVIHKYTQLWKEDKEHLCYIEFHTGQGGFGTNREDPFEKWSYDHNSNMLLWANWNDKTPLGFYKYDTHPNSTLNGETRGETVAPFELMWPEGGDYPSASALAAAKAKVGDFIIQADAAVEDGLLTIKAKITSKIAADDVKVKIALVEDNIHYSSAPTPGDDNGERDFNGVARVLLPIDGTDLESQSNETITFLNKTFLWDDPVVKENCRIAIWVQKYSGNSDVLAATDFPISDKITAGGPVMGNGTSQSSFSIVNESSGEDVTDGIIEVTAYLDEDEGQVIESPILAVKNISGSNINNVTVTQYIISAPEGAEATFCWSGCWNPTSDFEFTDKYGVKLDAGDTKTLLPEYFPHLQAGLSEIRYRVWDTANPADFSEISIKYNLLLSATPEFSYESIKAFPNPVHAGLLNITTPFEAVVEIYNIQGQKVLQKSLKMNRNTIDVNRLQSGIYFYSITPVSKNGIIVNGKFLKE